MRISQNCVDWTSLDFHWSVNNDSPVKETKNSTILIIFITVADIINFKLYTNKLAYSNRKRSKSHIHMYIQM